MTGSFGSCPGDTHQTTFTAETRRTQIDSDQFLHQNSESFFLAYSASAGQAGWTCGSKELDTFLPPKTVQLRATIAL
jgi:hypothetical protein